MSKFLIAGLGNIGTEYEFTRHNVGFEVANALAKSLVKNGEATDKLFSIDKHAMIHVENLLVITDDLALPFGTLRLKKKGSDGGHNGLADIALSLNTTDYNRLRFGVGSDFSKGKQVDYVLGKWNTEEQKTLPERIERSVEIVKSFIGIGVDRTMSEFNNK